jgi:hypothetical protein
MQEREDPGGVRQMNATTRYPGSASVYELVRTRPGAIARLSKVGVTRDLYDHRIGDAARAVGVPVERLRELVEEESSAP